MANVTAEVTCRMCKEVKQLKVTSSGLQRYKQGEHVQHCFPTLSAYDRELLISGTCGTCFDKMFSSDDE